MKKKTIITLSIILGIVVVWGVGALVVYNMFEGSDDNSKKDKDKDQEKFVQAQKTLEDFKTAEFNMNLSIHVDYTGQAISYEQGPQEYSNDFESEYVGKIDVENKKVLADMTYDSSIVGLQQGHLAEFVEGDDLWTKTLANYGKYTKTSLSDFELEGGRITKVSEITDLQIAKHLPKDTEVSFKEGEYDDKDVYIYELEMDNDTQKAVAEMMGKSFLMEETMPGMSLEYSKIILDLDMGDNTYTLMVNKDDSNDIYEKISFNGVTILMKSIGYEYEVTEVEFESHYENLNQDMTIEKPED